MVNLPDEQLFADLARRLGPRGFTRDAADLDPWLTDWRGRIRGAASALLSPATREEVADIVRMAADAKVAIVPQGGNTSMVAGATPSDGALLVSLRRMNAFRSISAEDNVATVEAGVILSDLHAAAENIGRRFPLSLAAKGSATIGGLISTNAGGTQVLRFGPMRSLLLGIEAVLPDGSLFESLSALRKDNRGYDLRQLLAGAEGTLGIVTAASLRLFPAAGARAVGWVGLPNAQSALDLLRYLEARLGEGIEGYELVPADALELVLKHIPGMRDPLQTRHRWNVLVELVAAADASDPVAALAQNLGDAIERGIGSDATVAQNEAQADSLWALRENISEAERLDGTATKHDISVRVADMPRFLEEKGSEVERAFPGCRVIAFGHLGDGNIHFNVRAPKDVDGQAWLAEEGAEVTRFVHDLVASTGGSLSAEHGIGQLKLSEFARLAGPVRLAALRAIKDALDPHGIMNPGKLVPSLALNPVAP